MRSMELEQLAICREAEARRKEEEASKKVEEVLRLEEKARQSMEEAECGVLVGEPVFNDIGESYT